VISLDITNTNYNTAVDRWYLTAICSQPEIYELYDLVVDADGIIADTTRNAVHLIPEIKTNYSFIHITDTHLPTHIFYPDPISLTDSTEIEDLREVIRDINLIKPEFVLLTGDLLNEGELEDFENRRVYTKAQKILEELEVPLYLTSGNHDLGGWDSTPPSQGTARRDWWRFFGWSWLLDPPALDPYYTQNYSFDYGPIHYIGMEAYLNYDSYLYNIYDGESFTDLQMQWLENDLNNASSSESHVIFYHNDFSDQIDLDNMGIEMALYGHIHSNSGSITSPPYNLSTESTCDGNRAYRVININDDQLEPTNAVYAGYSGGELTATFTPENSGAADSIFCYVENSHNLDFNDAQLKFIMPNNAEEYIVFNGILTQVDESGDFAVCYISVDIPANGNVSVSVVADLDASAQNPLTPQDLQLTNYPNPFNPTTTISFSLAESSSLITLGIYNLKGQKVKDLSGTLSRIEGRREMQHSVVWNGTDDKGVSVSSGIYFVRLNCGNKEAQQKIMLLK
jgi:predicted MPP superfamily phosphohydrolase